MLTCEGIETSLFGGYRPLCLQDGLQPQQQLQQQCEHSIAASASSATVDGVSAGEQAAAADALDAGPSTVGLSSDSCLAEEEVPEAAAAAAEAEAAAEAAEAIYSMQHDGEVLQVPGFDSVRLLPAPDSTEAADSLKQSFVYALITVDSSYLLHLLQPQQAGKLALLMRLQESDRTALLQQPQVAQLLDEVYAQSQQQQQQQADGVEVDGCDDDSSMLFIPTDEEEW
jgi:hypothetical protein